MQKLIPGTKAVIPKSPEAKKKWSRKVEMPAWPWPGILLFIVSVIIALAVYKDYGISWDEPEQRLHGLQSYNYIFYGNQELFTTVSDHHGMGFELLLVIIEKLFRLTDTRDIYLMRHLFTHVFFLISALSLYILAYRLFKSKFIASLGFIMLVVAPRLYAHSFFNTRDIPFLSMFIIALTCCQIAFDKNKPLLFFILGLLCGYATGIRIMGIMLVGFILLFLFIDLVTISANKGKLLKPILNILLFSVGFCLLLFLSWPFLWIDPVNHFSSSFTSFAHFGNAGYYKVLFNGVIYNGENLPWYYLPTWFLISNPEAWLIAGLAAIVWISIHFFEKPLTYLKNTRERNFLLYFMCFFAPILSVILLHSVIYNDWRHLYFIYPSFVLIALYIINKLYVGKYRLLVPVVCTAQVGILAWFMVKNHPFEQIYFNNFVSHAPRHLLKNYDLEYWGCSYKQGLQFLLATEQSKTIKVNCFFKVLLDNNMLMLPEKDRERIKYSEKENADYFIPAWTMIDIPDDTMSTKIDSISVLNSNVFSIYKRKKSS